MSDYFAPSPRASKRRRVESKRVAHSNPESEESNQRVSRTASKVQKTDEESSVEGEEVAVSSLDDEQDTVHHGRNNSANGAAQHGTKEWSDKNIDISSTVNTVEDEGDENTITVQPRSSGRERRRPRRYSLSQETPEPKRSGSVTKPKRRSTKRTSEADETCLEQAAPKGILTPSRKEKRFGPRKSVLFSQTEKEMEEQLGFKDIKDTNKKKLRTFMINVEVPSDHAIASPGTPSKRPRSAPVIPAVAETEWDDEVDGIEILHSNQLDTEIEPVDIDFDDSGVHVALTTDEPTLLSIKTIVLGRLVSRTFTAVPFHLQTQYDSLHSLLQATIASGESNSLLLLGARGTGKSHLINTAIADLSSKHLNDFHTIRLNGFYQTDDRLALREIWRQLGREMQVEEMENGELGGSYADTMSSLLSLLSHPDEFDVDIDDQARNKASIYRTSKSVVFILDEFDLFTTHPRQTLLYNLFDIAQSKKAPIAVIGCSTRVDVVDCLEKRVKSRFSHRWLHIPSVKTLDTLVDIVKNVLSVEDSGATSSKPFMKDIQGTVRWNDHIKSDFLQSPDIQGLIKHIFYTTRSIPELFTALYIPIARLSMEKSFDISILSAQSRIEYSKFEPTLLTTLSYLPTIQLSLLIAASRLDTIYNLTTMNFNLVFSHYVELISRSKLQITASGAVAVGAALRQWSRGVAQSAWHDLGLYECIVPGSGGAGAGIRDSGTGVADNTGGEGASVRMWRVEVTLEEIEWSIKQRWKESGGTRDVLVKWCKEI